MAIRTRLTFWYTGLLAVALFLFGALLYSLLDRVLISVQDDRLETQARQIVNTILQENDPVAVLTSGRARLPSIDIFASQYYIQIVNLNGEPVQTSENLQGNHLTETAQVISDFQAGNPTAYSIDIRGSTRLRVYSEPIVIGGQPIGAVQVGQSLSSIDDTLKAIRSTMLLGSLGALLLAAAGGVVLARAALRPIQSIGATARQITQAEDLSRRIPVAVPHDELGQLTGTINDMLARLEHLFDTQQRLVADVSHELRTPLTTIRGNLDLLHRGAVEDPVLRGEALRAIEDETARMSRLVNDLLLLAKADAGLKLSLQPVELDTLLLGVYRQALVMAESQNVTLRLGAEDQSLVLGDEDRLRQLLLNLLDNAVKYSPAGGQVTLNLHRSGEWVQITVTDQGVGIPPEDLPHIFDRFYRADPSRGRPGGAGLGLSIAHWIAEAHGGRLSAESQIGRGSTFHVWLPLATVPAEADEEPEWQKELVA